MFKSWLLALGTLWDKHNEASQELPAVMLLKARKLCWWTLHLM